MEKFTLDYPAYDDISLGYLIPFFLLMFYNGQPGANGKRSQLAKWGFYIYAAVFS